MGNLKNSIAQDIGDDYPRTTKQKLVLDIQFPDFTELFTMFSSSSSKEARSISLAESAAGTQFSTITLTLSNSSPATRRLSEFNLESASAIYIYI